MTMLATPTGLDLHNPNRSLDPDINQMVSSQVDDLVKYQVVQLLHEHPDAVGDASFFAIALGFHSAEYTQSSLEELVNCGILHRETCPGNGKPLYCLSDNPQVRKRITRLCNLSNKVAVYDELLTLLASRSLQRAAKRAKGKPRGSATA